MNIRPAKPEDIPFLARIMLIASRSHMDRGPWDEVFDTEDQIRQFIELRASHGTRHFASWHVFLVADIQGQSAGALACYQTETEGIPAAREATIEAFRQVTPNDWPSRMARAVKEFSVFPSDEPGFWMVEHVGVLPDHRRKGIAQRLLSNVCDKLRGKASIKINILNANQSMRSLLESCSFEQTGPEDSKISQFIFCDKR